MTIITLTTDFGTEDAYVAQMKGVLCSTVSTAVRIVDLSHTLPPQDLRAAERFLATAVPTFPAGTVHLAVVDPGVGSSRAPLAVSFEGQWLVVPDNGIASAALEAGALAYALDASRINPHSVSSTFHGRDVFAPAAAALAMGRPVEAFGTRLETPVCLPRRQPMKAGGEVAGEILHVDHFGNLISNIRWTESGLAEPVEVYCGGQRIGPVRDHYAEAKEGELLALIDSQGYLEVAQRNGSAARTLGVSVGADVRVHERRV